MSWSNDRLASSFCPWSSRRKTDFYIPNWRQIQKRAVFVFVDFRTFLFWIFRFESFFFLLRRNESRIIQLHFFLVDFSFFFLFLRNFSLFLKRNWRIIPLFEREPISAALAQLFVLFEREKGLLGFKPLFFFLRQVDLSTLICHQLV